MWQGRFVVVLWLLSGSVVALAGPEIPSEVDDAEEIGRDIRKLMPSGVSPQTKKKLEIINGIKDEVDLESPPFGEEDAPQVAQVALDQLDRKYEEARAALDAISSTDETAKKVKKAAKFVDEFEVALASWTALLDERTTP
ncbi:MAG: hypothetical protein JRI25_02510 [Deltaproteobacteria bacterium]|nr:hypothetical protein [Deltaproteobacteria bacterium]MBW2253455.1 hypothetical protein [Deltaproteobacteria bacterium]